MANESTTRLTPQFEPLEPRRLLAAAGTSVAINQVVSRIQPETLGRSFDRTERAQLLDRLDNLPAATHAALTKRLKTNRIGAFDDILLGHYRSRRHGHFFHDESHAQPIAQFVRDNDDLLDQEQTLDRATAITRRRFPKQSSVSSYSARMPDDVRWNNPDPRNARGVEFLHALHRHDWFDELAHSYRYTGNARFARELTHQIADWSIENPTSQAPANWSLRDRKAWWFDTAIRVDQWMWAYFAMLDSPLWTPAANSLFLHKLVQQGDVMEQILPDVVEYGSNKTLALGRSLHALGLVFPEFDHAQIFETEGRRVLFRSMDAQLYDDGSHVEQSPGYAVLIADDLLEARLLDAINGVDWANARNRKLSNAINTIWQTLTPDSRRPAIGDTYRLPVSGLFLRASLIQESTIWPTPRPSLKDIWLLGPDKVARYMGNQTIEKIGHRGATYSLPDSGLSIMRSGNDKYARQLTFDAGPKGGGHGHFDLLGIELYGYGKPLVADPGAFVYDDSPSRRWVVSTAAHNTIGVAGVNHAAIESDWRDYVTATPIREVAGGYQVSASHVAYKDLAGQPIVGRSVWFDGSGMAVIVDFAESKVARTYETSFNLPRSTTLVSKGRAARSDDDKGNVRVDVLLRRGQRVRLDSDGIFATSQPPPDHVDRRKRLAVSQRAAKFVVFATVVRTSLRGAPEARPDVAWKHVPTSVSDAAVLTINGRDVSFAIPTARTLAARARLQARG
jgi:hypothetical protein